MMSKWSIPLVWLMLSWLVGAEPVTGRVQIAGAPELKLVDGWVGSDCTPRFFNVFLVPYRSPKHLLEPGKPYVQVCAWFPKEPDLGSVTMATFTVYGLGTESENKYCFNDTKTAQQLLQQLQVRGKKWFFATSMGGVKSPYPKVPTASWTVQATVTAPTTP